MRRTLFAHFLYSVTRLSRNYKLLSNLMDIYKNAYTVFDNAQILDSSKKPAPQISFSYKSSFSPSRPPSYYTDTMMPVFVVDFGPETRTS